MTCVIRAADTMYSQFSGNKIVTRSTASTAWPWLISRDVHAVVAEDLFDILKGVQFFAGAVT